jgi:hypothetical protein
LSKSDRYAPHPNAPEVIIKVLAPYPDQVIN